MRLVLVMFKGATAYEAAIGRYWIKILRPSFWRYRRLKIVTVGVQVDEEGDHDGPAHNQEAD